jgi:hypothetical protein
MQPCFALDGVTFLIVTQATTPKNAFPSLQCNTWLPYQVQILDSLWHQFVSN